jgi:hypothetical protein
MTMHASLTLLDTRAAAQVIGLAPSTLAKLRVTGGGPTFRKVLSKVLYERTALEQWLEARPNCTSTATYSADAQRNA